MNQRGKLKNIILFDNQSTVRLFINPYLIFNICQEYDPVYVHTSDVTTHCDNEGTLICFWSVLLFKYGITNILPFSLVHDKYNVSYDYSVETFTIHNPEKDTHFHFRLCDLS